MKLQFAAFKISDVIIKLVISTLKYPLGIPVLYLPLLSTHLTSQKCVIKILLLMRLFKESNIFKDTHLSLHAYINILMYENTFKRTDIFWFDKFTWHWVELLMYLTCNNAQLLYTIHYTLQGPLSCFLTLTWWLLSKVSLILLKEILFCLLEMETKTEH